MNFDNEIENFLRIVSLKAAMADITPKVTEWIEKEDFKGIIGLSIRV